MASNDICSSSMWWTDQTLAVVTGANKGIGFEIVRQLAEKGLTVVLTARDVNRGMAATKCLHGQGLVDRVVFHQLDIQSSESVSEFVGWLKDNYGGLDILINNAAVSGFDLDLDAAKNTFQGQEVPDLFVNPIYNTKIFPTNYELAKNCIDINYYGTKRITEALLPLFRFSPAGSRIVNVSSEAGLLQWVRNDSLRQELSDVSKINEEMLDKMLKRFLEDLKCGDIEGKGWPALMPQYALAKIALNGYGRLLAHKFSDEKETIIYVNSVHPGRAQTDMVKNLGALSPSEGAESSVMVSLLPPGGSLTGQFYYMKQLHPF